MKKPVTIVEVAAQAGVSIKTVSRVINDAPNVRPELRARVVAAIEALRYRPNPAARSLPGSRNYLIALVYENPVSDYIGKLQQGAISRCREHGYNLLLEPIESGDHRPIMDMLLRLTVDGLIIVPPISDDPAALALLDRAAVPYVRIAPQNDEYRSAFVMMDDELAAFQMTGHLIALGHERIGFVEGDPAHSAAKRRLDGYKRALEQAGIEEHSAYVQPGLFDFRTGFDAAERMLRLPAPPTAIFAANDETALGVLAQAHRQGLDVPADLSICGFDDSILSTTIWPKLTSVRQPAFEMAAAAASLLIEGKAFVMKNDRRAERCLLDFELKIRASTAPPRGETPH